MNCGQALVVSQPQHAARDDEMHLIAHGGNALVHGAEQIAKQDARPMGRDDAEADLVGDHDRVGQLTEYLAEAVEARPDRRDAVALAGVDRPRALCT